MIFRESGTDKSLPQDLAIFRRLIYKKITDSTNEDAVLIARRGSESHGIIIAAKRQDAGKGRSGRSWISPPGSGITASFIVKNPFPPRKYFLPTVIASVAVCRFLERNWALCPRIKWPNDVLVDNRKIAGILTENESGMTVIGIGVNLNTDFTAISGLETTATSVYRETGRRSRDRILIPDLARHLERIWLKSLKSQNVVFDEWKRRLLFPAGTVRLVSDGSHYTGRILGVRSDGGLRLKTGRKTVVLYNCDTVHPENRIKGTHA